MMTPRQATALALSPWTDLLIADLIRLWGEGWPISAIGQRLGFSRNACVGKAHRLALPSRASPIKARRQPRNIKPSLLKMLHHPQSHKPKLATRPKPTITERPQRPMESVGWPVSAARTCRYPLWDDIGPATQAFCGAGVVLRPIRRVLNDQVVINYVATSWCPTHFAKCHVRVRSP